MSPDAITLHPVTHQRLLDLEHAYDVAAYNYTRDLVVAPETEECRWLEMGRVTSQLIDLLRVGLKEV